MELGVPVQVGVPKKLFNLDEQGISRRGSALSQTSDGRFLAPKKVETEGQQIRSIVVVRNWLEEFRDKR